MACLLAQGPTRDAGSTTSTRPHWFGAWKLSDALFACAFEGTWCEFALGNTPGQRYMGTWSDGVPVAELQVFDNTTASTP